MQQPLEYIIMENKIWIQEDESILKKNNNNNNINGDSFIHISSPKTYWKLILFENGDPLLE